LNQFLRDVTDLSAIRAVVLDWAGTMVDYGSCAPMGVFVELFAKHGVAISVAEAREPMGVHKRDHIRAVMRMPAVTARWRAQHGADPTEQDVERLYEEATPLQVACLPRYAAPIPGALALVNALRAQGIGVGSTTGYNTEMLDTLAAASAKHGYAPDVRNSADLVPTGRPAPFMCWEALKRLGVWPASACVAVGDTPSDMEAGRNAGMWTIGVTLTGNEVGLPQAELEALSFSERRRLAGGARRRLQDAGAHATVDGVHELLGLLPDLARRIRRGSRPG
jgi:phosphonoacetaldehyde hydrolase